MKPESLWYQNNQIKISPLPGIELQSLLGRQEIYILKSARLAVAVILVLSVVYHVPTYMAYNASWDNNTGEIMLFLQNEFGKSDFYQHVYTSWINLTVNFALPFLLLFVFNALLLRALRSNRSILPNRRTFSLEEQRLTFMVLCMTLIFFVCQLLAALSKIAMISYTNYHEPPPEVNSFSAVADTFVLINSAINFAIYCVTGRRFRQTFVRIFCHCKTQDVFQANMTLRSQHHYSRVRGCCLIQSAVPKRSTTLSSLSSSNSTKSSQMAVFATQEAPPMCS